VTVRRRLASVTAAVFLIATQSTAPMAAAYGDGTGRLLFDVPDDGHGFVEAPSRPLISTGGLAPGYDASGDIRVKNDSGHPIDLRLQATDVVDDENGCIEQETRDGDDSCDEGTDGELGDWLEITLVDLASDADTALWTGSVFDLEEGAVLAEALPVGAALSLRMTTLLPYAAGNDTMTDRVGYDLRWTASTNTGAATIDILGTELSAPGSGPTTSTGLTLPFTGTTLAPWQLASGVAAVAVGVALMTNARRRRYGVGGVPGAHLAGSAHLD